MKIYIEYVFMLNFLLDYMILYGTKKILRIVSNNKRLLLGSLVGSITTFIPYFNISDISLIFTKIILSILIIIVTFGFNDFIIRLFYFYMISILLGGVLYLFDISLDIYIKGVFILIVFIISIYLLFKMISYFKRETINHYKVIIYFSNKKYILDGYLDTGNYLKSPYSNKSIILCNLNINYNTYIYIPYHALNYNGVIPCIKPDKIIINNKIINNCLVGVSKDKFNLSNCSCILPNKLKEEL